MNPLMKWLDGQKATGVLITRVVLGVILIVAGYGKLFGYGIDGVIGYFNSIGLFAAPVLGVLVSLLEFFGGIAILLGVFTRLLSIWVIVQFVLITIYVKPVLMGDGWSAVRIDLTLATMGFLLLTGGAGPLALGKKIFKGKSWAH